MRRIILPQALRRMLPALTNRGIEIFKMSTLASAVAYVELLQQGKLIASLNYNPIEAYTVIALIFFAAACTRWCRPPMCSSGGCAKATETTMTDTAATAPAARHRPAQALRPATRCSRASTSTCRRASASRSSAPRGSGKSTLLRCLNFMELPSAGRVELGGRPIGTERRGATARSCYSEAELTRVRQRVGMVFQQFNLFPHMTALGNVMEGLRTVKRPGREPRPRARARDQLERVGLADKADTLPGAAVRRPEAARGDRPRAGDGARADAVRRAHFGARPGTGRRGAAGDPRLAEEGRTMLLVTHELGFAYHFANRVLFIADGVIHEQGTPDEVLKHPRQAAHAGLPGAPQRIQFLTVSGYRP